MDPQSNASTGLNVDIHKNDRSIYDVIINNKNIKNCITKTDIDYLDLLPSNPKLAGAEIELVSMFTRESILKDALANINGNSEFSSQTLLVIRTNNI